MKVVIAGGTGMIGQYLTARFGQDGDEVVVISRRNVQTNWEPQSLIHTIENSDLLINLAGASINCRHNNKNKIAILSSRTKSTRLLRDAVLACSTPPKVWVNASACGIYASNGECPNDESSESFAIDFLGEVVKAWEAEFFMESLPLTRQIALRTSVVFSKNGGALLPLSTLAKFGLGGKQGSGRQFFSWIHIEDYYQIVRFATISSKISGVVNCTSPMPISNSRLMYVLRQKFQQKIGLPAPSWMIKIASAILGKEASLILNSSNVIPRNLIDAGFKFNYPSIEECIDDLL